MATRLDTADAADAAARRKGYKAGVDLTKARRRREVHLVDHKRTARVGSLFKKRRDCSTGDESPPDTPSPPATPESGGPPASDVSPCTPPGEETELVRALSRAVKWACSNNPNRWLRAAVQLKKLISGENPPIEAIFASGVVTELVKFLSEQEFPQLQMEAAWAITNIAAGASEYTVRLTDCGAIPKLVELLSSSRRDTREQAAWALGNIAADSPGCGECVIEHGALPKLLDLFSNSSTISTVKTATRTLATLCYWKLPDSSDVERALHVIQSLIHSIDETILADACWAIYYLSGEGNVGIKKVIAARVVPQLAKLLRHPAPKVLIPVLSIFSRISASEDDHVQVIIDSGALLCFLDLLTLNHHKHAKKYVCLILSNIVAGTIAQIQAVLDANLVGPLLDVLRSGEVDVRREAAWFVTNATSGGSTVQIHYLVAQGCIAPLCAGLNLGDADLLYASLDGIENVLKAGEEKRSNDSDDNDGGTNPYADLVAECGGLDKLESLQGFNNREVYRKVIRILESYWVEEDD